MIGDWVTFWPPRPDESPTLLDHDDDESKPHSAGSHCPGVMRPARSAILLSIAPISSWCTMGVCGARAKTRAYRARSKGAP